MSAEVAEGATGFCPAPELSLLVTQHQIAGGQVRGPRPADVLPHGKDLITHSTHELQLGLSQG
jgi:hypothetical protein